MIILKFSNIFFARHGATQGLLGFLALVYRSEEGVKFRLDLVVVSIRVDGKAVKYVSVGLVFLHLIDHLSEGGAVVDAERYDGLA